MMKTKYLMNPPTGSVDTEENWISDSSEWSTDTASVADQLAALVVMEPITEDDEAAICEWLNCAEASVSDEGVWVCGPMTGHWLKEENIAKYLEWRGL
jgi:hypothetical protein